MTKYTIVGFVGSRPPAPNFSEHDWPLHVTLLDTFASTWNQEELIDQIRWFAFNSAQFNLLPEKKGLLGPNKDVPVKLLKIDQNLRRLHDRLFLLGKAGNFVYNTPEFVSSGFVPHITDEKTEQASLERKYLLKSVSLVDMMPDSDMTSRSIVGTFELST